MKEKVINEAKKYIKKALSVALIKKTGEQIILWNCFLRRKPSSKEICSWFNKWPDERIMIFTSQIRE